MVTNNYMPKTHPFCPVGEWDRQDRRTNRSIT